MLTIFNNPIEVVFRLGLYDSKLARRKIESLRSAVSKKFSLAFKSCLYANDCPKKAKHSLLI